MITLHCVKPLILPHVDLVGDVCGARGCVTGLAPETLSQPPEPPRRLQKQSTGTCCWLSPPSSLPHEPAKPYLPTRMKKEQLPQALLFFLLIHTTLGEALLFICVFKTSCLPLIWFNPLAHRGHVHLSVAGPHCLCICFCCVCRGFRISYFHPRSSPLLPFAAFMAHECSSLILLL